jgi:CRP/FNR family transcriptional regulator, cyclic AMP receptor protein
MSTQAEFAVLLGMNPLFAGLGPGSINRIAALCHTQKLDSGEMLFQKGDAGNELFGIRRGRIRIEINSAAGGQLALNFLGAGDMFGEIAVLDGQARTADAIAEEPSELFVLRRNDFMAYLEREPQVALKLIPLLCQRIRWVSDRMEESVMLPLETRLARRLCDLAADFGSEVHISQEQLGIYVGAARESVNRQLREWRQLGILEMKRGRILVLNADRLKAKAQKGRNTRY